MKKYFILSASVAVLLTACGGGVDKQKEQARQDSIKAAGDSIAAVVEAARQDSIKAVNDSIAKVELAESYNNALTLKVKNISFKYGSESTAGASTVTVSLTNNTKVNIDASDYTITYDYPDEVTKWGEIYECTCSGSAKGPAIPAGETVDFTFKGDSGTGKANNIKAKLTISKDNFLQKAGN